MMNKIQIIYCSNLVSNNKMNYLLNTSFKAPFQSSFKFHKLLTEGFSMNNCEVSAISSIPVNHTSHNRLFWTCQNEYTNGIHFYYLPFINLYVIKAIMIFLSSFFMVLFFRIRSKFKAQIICDVLLSGNSTGAILACKITHGKIIGIITDLPELLQETVSNRKQSLIDKLKITLNNAILNHYDGYIFLTSPMNLKINKNNKPYKIIEGLVDSKLVYSFKVTNKLKKQIILYSGGLYEKYGVKMLLEAFMKIKEENLVLIILGHGDMVDDLIKYSIMDERIKYYGVLPNEKVIELQQNATLLVNPRPSKEEFTKYSFPSKNMEYMASGTPLVTCKLSCIPMDHYRYIFTFEDESINGFAQTLKNILSLPEEVLLAKGHECREYVMREKNNVIQSKKILQLFQEL